MSGTHHVLDSLSNDLKAIVYRYIHQYSYLQCRTQYERIYIPCWKNDDRKCRFGGDVDVMWRDLEQYSNWDGGGVYRIYASPEQGRVADLPQDY